jgi:hypothetical protein
MPLRTLKARGNPPLRVKVEDTFALLGTGYAISYKIVIARSVALGQSSVASEAW